MYLNSHFQHYTYIQYFVCVQSTANLVECSMDLLRDALPKVIAARDTLIFRDSSVGQEALSDLHTKKKNIEHADNILVSIPFDHQTT